MDDYNLVLIIPCGSKTYESIVEKLSEVCKNSGSCGQSMIDYFNYSVGDKHYTFEVVNPSKYKNKKIGPDKLFSAETTRLINDKEALEEFLLSLEE